MSGLFGLVLAADGVVSAEDLAAMGEALRQSPSKASVPDETEVTTVRHEGVGLGVVPHFTARSSAMEIVRPEGRLLVAFHGVLYEESAPNRTANAAEWIASRYEREGMRFLRDMHGDYALAIWDEALESFFLATDPFRVESVLYSLDRGRLVFASHMRALLACPLSFPRSIDPCAVLDVVASSVVATPRTIFREVHKLPPGSLLVWRHGESRVETYWDMDYLHADIASEEELAHRLRDVMLRAVHRRLDAEPRGTGIGSFLSGGVDSTTVTRLLASTLEPPVPSYSIGFSEQHWNEMNYARIAARAAGVAHHEYFVTPEDAYSAIPAVVEAFDEPFANSSAIPTYYCAKLARENGTTILYAGDGGDELFAGNERYASRRVLDHYDRVPRWLRDRVVTPGVGFLADRTSLPILRRAQSYIRRASLPYPERLTSYTIFNFIPLRTLFTDELLEAAGMEWSPGGTIARHFHAAKARELLARELYLDLKITISDNDLLKVTRMTRAAGVVPRFPFLDREVAEFSATVPGRIMMRGGKLRAFFKRAYRDILPPAVIEKRKHGFGIPVAIWLGTHPPLREMMEDLLMSPSALLRGYVRREGIDALLQGHANDPKGYYGTFLWHLMMLELWRRRFHP